jgi:putative transposase
LLGGRRLTYADPHMRNPLLALLHLAVMTAKLCGSGGVRAVMAENLLLKQQLIVLRRARKRAPKLTSSDRLLCGFWSIFLSPGRIRKAAIALQPSTLLAFHHALVRCKYRRLFSSTPRPKKPGPKGPSNALIQAIVELKSRNPRFGSPRIALIISQTFGVDIDKNVVYRVLAKHYRPAPSGTGPSWLSFIGHTRDSLWSVDLFRCESIVLRSYWVLVVMDQFTRRLVGIGVHGGAVTGADLCCMFNAAIHGQGAPRHRPALSLCAAVLLLDGTWAAPDGSAARRSRPCLHTQRSASPPTRQPGYQGKSSQLARPARTPSSPWRSSRDCCFDESDRRSPCKVLHNE